MKKNNPLLIIKRPSGSDCVRLTLDFVQVAFLVFGEQVGVCIFSGIHFPHKQGFEPAVLLVFVA